MNNTKIVIVDDNLKKDDPLIVELSIEFQEENILLFEHSQSGADYVLDHITERMIVILDLNFSQNEINGHEVLRIIRDQSKLIPVIIWSAKDGFSSEDVTDFINNHAMFYVPQTSNTDEILARVKEANNRLKLDLATAIEEWFDLQGDKEKILLTHGNGQQYSANDLIVEIRKQSDVGQEIQENMLKLTIDLLFRDVEKI